jgi:hypothetical protein
MTETVVSYKCFGCRTPIELDQLLDVDKKYLDLERSHPELAKQYNSYFSHCDGDESVFHDNSCLGYVDIVNICPDCFQKTLAAIKAIMKCAAK